MSERLSFAERPASGDARGALVLLHGRGADEHDLLPLADVLDPEARLTVVTPRAPLALPPGGAHWYATAELGRPDPTTFAATLPLLLSLIDALPEHTGVPLEHTVLGGFSQGCVMTYAASLIEGGPKLAGTVQLSGFLPIVPGFAIEPMRALGRPTLIAHGSLDPVIGVEWGHAGRDAFRAASVEVEYIEEAVPHTIGPRTLTALDAFLRRVIA